MIKAIKGTKDTLPVDIPQWKFLEGIVSSLMSNYNYKEIRTPVFEETSLFARGIGETSDIVSKEMYTFIDRSGMSVTLKPEMTASVVRSYIEHSLDKKQVLNKLYYVSPMFRQERPQAGRFRQFHQFGAEAIGSHSPYLDAEIIILSYDIMKGLGLKDLTVKINSLGVPESREKYKEILKNFLSKDKEKLSEDSKKRFDSNILRIFDSKDERDQEIIKNAPLLIEHLDDESLEHFEVVKRLLLAAQIPFKIEPKLVRGLDYYTHTTYEIVSNSVGSQSALCGGGRYNLLIEELGGKPTPAVGFAAGMERILLACENEGCLNIPEEGIDVYVASFNKDLAKEVNEFALKLRRESLSVDLDYSERSVKAQMREANRNNARFVIFFGGEEYEQGKVVLKEMETGNQFEFDLNKIDLLLNKIKG